MTTSDVPRRYGAGCRFRQKCTKFRQRAKICGETGVGVVLAAALEKHNASRCAGRLVAGFWQRVSVFGLSVTIDILGEIIGYAIGSGIGKEQLLALLRQGGDVCLAARREQPVCKSVCCCAGN